MAKKRYRAQSKAAQWQPKPMRGSISSQQQTSYEDLIEFDGRIPSAGTYLPFHYSISDRVTLSYRADGTCWLDSEHVDPILDTNWAVEGRVIRPMFFTNITGSMVMRTGALTAENFLGCELRVLTTGETGVPLTMPMPAAPFKYEDLNAEELWDGFYERQVGNIECRSYADILMGFEGLTVFGAGGVI